ncbi:adenylate kinase isoenzyme 6-like [Symsagittifera roscoffensis]|uniref:adenylate kinase isoenzyme 6-like n=1 Tax=Symsagittifera roscoffensis TaxID=84072 RepID=UPI00307CBD38
MEDNTTSQTRTLPNILICGTPGTGKSTLAQSLQEHLGSSEYSYVNVGQIASDHSCFDEWDEEYECHVLNEDLLLDEMEPMMHPGGNIVDYHGCEFFPERWFDLVVVLRCGTEALYDRLKSRGYSEKKLSSNLDSEIFQTILEEAQSSYKAEIVLELQSNCSDDVQNNIETISSFVQNWLLLKSSSPS